ncbi:sensor histidine kinase [Pseudanabaena mucicola]|uniref:histidine kinase n=1 Tax=Pseudanabaena mucicola FACHB-723 TaxID=2692860 RepID=A0ABR7ZV52_9CYAN|nr:HAMP domain-containing sensor histidine kinase [Pseudanabaena mucicola]MBD2187624.1 HAMP domain-containing histidine kinase [Pseudanabaena mucicola FACHB-723]
MECENYISKIKQLEKENRILQKKLERSEIDRAKLENTNRNKESLLKQVICGLQEYQVILEKKSDDLETTLKDLSLTQHQLVEVKKMAALGALVAGVAHEINTPVGTSITLASTLADATHSLLKLVASGNLKKSSLSRYLEIASEVSSLILSNLRRAGELVHSFKQVAVDQSSSEKRDFKVKEYIEEVILSISPQLKYSLCKVFITGNDLTHIYSYPGALAQVITNLVNNSITHAYLPNKTGDINIDIQQNGEQVIIQYSDDGIGIDQQIFDRIFEPFFTTAREKGGTGLGLHITYNLVTQKLQGSIKCESEVNKGTIFILTLPSSITS